MEEDRMTTVRDTKQTKTPLVHRASTTCTKSMAENVKKIAITTDNNHRQRNSVMEHSACDNNVKKIAITNETDNKLPLLKGIDQVCYYKILHEHLNFYYFSLCITNIHTTVVPKYKKQSTHVSE